MNKTRSMVECHVEWDQDEGVWRLMTMTPCRRRVPRLTRIRFGVEGFVLVLPITSALKQLYDNGWPCPRPHKLVMKSGLSLNQLMVKL